MAGIASGSAMSSSATSAPRRASSTAVTRPMPRAAPVTSATLPASGRAACGAVPVCAAALPAPRTEAMAAAESMLRRSVILASLVGRGCRQQRAGARGDRRKGITGAIGLRWDPAKDAGPAQGLRQRERTPCNAGSTGRSNCCSRTRRSTTRAATPGHVLTREQGSRMPTPGPTTSMSAWSTARSTWPGSTSTCPAWSTAGRRTPATARRR